MYMNEDVAWERLKNIQREMENSRAMAADFAAGLRSLRLLAARVWWLAGLAMQRAPRQHRVINYDESDESASSEVA